MAIDERNVSAGVVHPEADEGEAGTEVQTERANLGLDDLRLRLDSPLFARDPALAAPAQVPRIRELTWEHVVNPTSQHAVIEDGQVSPADESADPAPRVRIEDLLAAPADPFPETSPPAADESADAAPADVARVDVAPADVGPADASPVDAAPAAESPPRRSAVAPALPSFAAMLSADAPQAPTRDIHSSSVVDDLMRPIEEPPPVARDTDPEIAGLAELIVRATPVSGMPRVEAVRDALRGDTGAVPVVAPEDDEPTELQVVAQFAPPTPAGGVAAVAEQRAPIITGTQPALSAVEAELNRLAYLPDQEEDMGPVEVPEIAYSDVRSAEPAMEAPVLSQAELYAPRQSAAPVRHAYTELVEKGAPVVPRRRNRHLVRRAVSTVVLLAMVAGGLYAVKYFVLDRVKWASEVAPLANEVETARSLQFDHDIDVVTLPSVDYALKLSETTHGITDTNVGEVQRDWRALGVLTGTLDEAAVGLAAMADSPAFYEPTTETIYVVDGLDPELHAFAMHRALTMALLDQRFGWGDRIATAAPAVARGTRALYDADAMAVALSLLDDGERTAVTGQLYKVYADYKIPASPSPFAAISAGRLGLALWPYLDAEGPAQRDVLETDALVTDGQVLDLRRLTAGETETVDDSSQGMLFWYHVLAARVDDDLAWNAALGWRNDDLAVAPGGTANCIAANVSIDDAHAAVATAAFAAWAAAAPVESTTSVSSVPGASGAPTTITVTACDPGAAVATNDGALRLSLGGAPLRVQQYRTLVDPPNNFTEVQAACAVYGTDAVSMADERGIVDPVEGWTAPAAHPVPDPATMGCLTP